MYNLRCLRCNWQLNYLILLSIPQSNPIILVCSLLVLTSAKAALSPTPSMLAYGAAKAAVIHLAQSAAPSIPGRLCTLLPVVLDTEANRQDMPDANKETWTPCPVIGEYKRSIFSLVKFGNGLQVRELYHHLLPWRLVE